MMIQIKDSNTALVTLNDGTEILFSYDTPVAGKIVNDDALAHLGQSSYPEGYFVSATKHSATTSRKIGAYLTDNKVQRSAANVINQDRIEALADMI